MNVFRAKLAGYAHLVKQHAIEAPALLHASSIDDISARRSVTIGMTVEETFPVSYDPGDSDVDHLIFALKYDGVDLAVLRRLFAKIDREQLMSRIEAQPTSKYIRRLFFLFERLTGEKLVIADLSKGSYTPALDPDEYFVAAGRPVARYRVTDTCPATQDFARWSAGPRSSRPPARRTSVDASGRSRRGRCCHRHLSGGFRIERGDRGGMEVERGGGGSEG